VERKKTFLDLLDGESLLLLLEGESPLVIGVILEQLEVPVAAFILKNMSPTLGVEVMEKIAKRQRVSNEVLELALQAMEVRYKQQKKKDRFPARETAKNMLKKP
jgi:flagellar motor switch protein FliG